MLGAIIGDIVGSVYEWHNIKTKDFPLFRDDCFFTDDSIMTIAVAEALLNGKAKDIYSEDLFIDAMRKYGRMYPDAGYGGRFGAWLRSNTKKPYNSWGNGSAMRVSPVGFFYPISYDLTGMEADVHYLAEMSAAVTHNHPEGIKGALATADSIMIMRMAREPGNNVEERRNFLKGYIERKYGYDMSKTLDEIRPTYRFNESCQDTVPQAITAFLESIDFEDAIRNAISLGGDSDTLAAITGGIAEAAYGIPDRIKDKALSYLDEPLKEVIQRWDAEVTDKL